ncbi:MAG: Rieske (2Fe-2S) protein [Pyrinomonadaceae bacterium]
MPSTESHNANLKKPVRENSRVTVGRAEDVPQGFCATIDLPGGKELALYNVEGQFYATENFCPHKGTPLADGHLCDHIIECHWHNWRFDVRTGQCLTNNAAIETYDVVIEDGEIKIIV